MVEFTFDTKNDSLVSVLVIVPAVIGIIFAGYESWMISRIKLTGPSRSSESLENRLKEDGVSVEEQLATMKSVSEAIALGANAYLWRQFQCLIGFVAVICVALGFAINWTTSVCFCDWCLDIINLWFYRNAHRRFFQCSYCS